MTDLFRRQRWLCDQEVADKFVCHKGGGGDGAGGDGLSGGWGNEGYGLGAGYGYGGDSQGMGGQYGDASSWGGLAGPDAGAFGGSGEGGGGGFGSASSWGSGMDAYAAMTGVPGFPDAHIGIAAPAPNFGVNAVGNPYGLTGPTGVEGLGGIYGLPGADTEATFADAPAVAGHAGPGFDGPGFGGTGARGEGMGGPTGGFSGGVSGGPAGGPGAAPGADFSSWSDAEAAGVPGLAGGPDAVGGNGLGNVGANLGVNFADVTNPNPLSAFPNADPRATASDPVASFVARFGPVSGVALQHMQTAGSPEQAVISMARQAGIMGGTGWQNDFTNFFGVSPGTLFGGLQGVPTPDQVAAAAARGGGGAAVSALGFPSRFGIPGEPGFGRPGAGNFGDMSTEDTTLADLAPGVNFNPTVDPSTVVDRGFNTIAAGPGNPGLAGLNPSAFQGRFGPGFSPDLMAALAAMGIPGKSGVDPSQDPMGPVAAVPSPVADPRGRLGPMGKDALPDVFRGLDLPIEVQPPVPSTPVAPTPQPDPRGPPAAPPSEIVFGPPSTPPTEPRGPIDEGGVPFPGVQPISPNMIPGGIEGLQPGSFAPRLSPREMALLAQKFS